MSFFTATTNINSKPHIRQNGFAPDDLYTSSNSAFHGKYPSPPLNLPSLDFGDDLAGLMAADANGNGNSRSSPPNGYQQQQNLHQDDHYRHNIFDTQSPHHSLSLSLGADGSSSHQSYSSSHHSYSHSLSIPKSPTGFTSSTSSSSNGQVTSPLLTTLPLGNGSATSRARSHSHSISHGQQQQHHGHHGHTASLSHSLSHSGGLNGGLNPMGSLGMGGGYAMNGMGMNSLGGSMGMMGMGNMGVANGGLSLGPLQSPTLQSPTLSTNNVNSSLSTSLPSPPGPLLTSSSPTSSSTTTTNYQDKQSLLANEKRRRRRESHNAVERRRRDNINEKISELATLIPECMLEGGSGVGNGNTNTSRGSSSPISTSGGIGLLDSSDPLLPSSYGLPNGNGNNGSSSPISGIKEENGAMDGENGGVVKANKGMILRKSVDYIRYLQQLVTAQGARNRELEQELKAYRRSSSSDSSPILNGYPQRRSNAIGGGGTRTTSHSRSSPSDEGREEDSMMLHDSVDGNRVGGGSVIEFGSYGGADGRGGLPSMPEGDNEDVDYGDSPQHHHHHQHHQHHHQHPHHHQHHHQQEDMVVDNLGMGMNMEMMGGMNAMNGGALHFGMDNNNSNATAEDLRGRPRVARHLESDGATAADKNATGAGGALKEEDDDIVGVVGGFGIGNGRITRGM